MLTRASGYGQQVNELYYGGTEGSVLRSRIHSCGRGEAVPWLRCLRHVPHPEAGHHRALWPTCVHQVQVNERRVTSQHP